MTANDTTRDDWLTWRRDGIGASDVAGILGLSPWASPWSIWADKAGLLPPLPDDEAMAAGRWLEAAIGPWFTHETGLHVAGEQTQCTHIDHGHHRCTVDGFVFDSPGDRSPLAIVTEALGLLEIKVTGPGRRWDEVPAHYQTQGQWQMHVTGLDHVWFAVLMGRRLDIHKLERDQADIDFMVGHVDRFWHDHVATGTPPAVDGHDATQRALAAVYPEHTPGKTAEITAGYMDALVAAKAAVKAARTDEKAVAAAIEAELGDAEEGVVDGRRVVTWRTQTRRSTCKACGHVTESEPFRVLRPVPPPKEKP